MSAHLRPPHLPPSHLSIVQPHWTTTTMDARYPSSQAGNHLSSGEFRRGHFVCLPLLNGIYFDLNLLLVVNPPKLLQFARYAGYTCALYNSSALAGSGPEYNYIYYIHILWRKEGTIEDESRYCLVMHSLDSDTLPQTALDTPCSNQIVNVR